LWLKKIQATLIMSFSKTGFDGSLFMNTFRAILRVILVSSGTLVLYLTFTAGTLFLLLSPGGRIRWRNFMVQSWAKMAAGFMGIRIHQRGAPPQPPFFLVSNHLSYIDIIVYFTQMNCVFIAKKEVSSWPVVGYLAQAANTLFIDRRNHRDIARVNSLISREINQYQGVILFPEGTSSGGDTVKPFRPSLLAYPAEQKMAVYYAAIRYRTPQGAPPEAQSVCWWGDMTFGSHVFNLFKIPYFDAFIEFGEEAVQDNDRKVLAQTLWQEVYDLFIAASKSPRAG
jgi:1-acyl-sn-glycerol-3-phosphate acyltransferase